jgi:hypothetical protein
MRHLCVLKADMSGLEDSLIKRRNRYGHTYWRLDYDVVMSFKRSELQAKLTWEENVRIFWEPNFILSHDPCQGRTARGTGHYSPSVDFLNICCVTQHLVGGL